MKESNSSLLNEVDRHLRIFFSVDICESTIFKSKNKEWKEIYLQFFDEFPSTFIAEVLKQIEICKKRDRGFETKLHFWKFLGDELIFTDTIHTKWEAFAYTKAFYFTLLQFNSQLSEKQSIQIKGSAWTAGFPIRNKSYSPPVTPSEIDNNQIDFIGPDMDIGFRLGKLARPGRVVISMDLADVLTQVSSKENFSFYHVGWEVLKGVFDDKPYPVFWIVNEVKDVVVLPWEEATCNFTNRFLETKDISARNLRRKIQEIRDAHKNFKLFEPYFDIKDAPQEHQMLWKEEKEKLKKEKDNLDVGEIT